MAVAKAQAATSVGETRKLVDSFGSWHHIMELAPGVITPGSYDPRYLLERLELPADMTGLRALDVGANDGFYTLEMHRRGAQVVSLDYRPKELTGFPIVEKVFGVKFEHINANLYELGALKLGTFDVVLFLGVLYHLPDPVRALSLLRSVCKGELFLETYVEHFDSQAATRYYRGSSLGNDLTNFFAPNMLCIHDWMQDAGFNVTRMLPFGDRCIAHGVAIDNLDKMHLAYGRIGG